MIYKRKPKDFNPRFEVVSCFCEHEGQILMLHRLDEKSEGNKWGVPAGKVDPGETVIAALVREIWEETGNHINPSSLEFLKRIYVKYSTHDFIFSMYKAKLKNKFKVIIRPEEHKDYQWIEPHQALSLPLVQDMEPCIKIYLFGKVSVV